MRPILLSADVAARARPDSTRLGRSSCSSLTASRRSTPSQRKTASTRSNGCWRWPIQSYRQALSLVL